MDKVIEYRKAIDEKDNPVHLDESGTRYFEPYLAELFAALGLYNTTDAPTVVHSLNAWVRLETQGKRKGTTDEH